MPNRVSTYLGGHNTTLRTSKRATWGLFCLFTPPSKIPTSHTWSLMKVVSGMWLCVCPTRWCLYLPFNPTLSEFWSCSCTRQWEWQSQGKTYCCPHRTHGLAWNSLPALLGCCGRELAQCMQSLEKTAAELNSRRQSPSEYSQRFFLVLLYIYKKYI